MSLRDREYARPSMLPEWMKDFAENNLKREADGKSPFEEIRGLFQLNMNLSDVDQKVSELTKRIGLDRMKIAGEDKMAAEESLHPNEIAKLARKLADEAIRLEKEGFMEQATVLDKALKRLMALSGMDEEMPEDFKKNPALKIFIDNICRSRGGHVSIHAIMKMIRDERPENIESAESLKKYIENKLGEEKQEVADEAGDMVAGQGVGASVSKEEQREALKMWEPSDPL